MPSGACVLRYEGTRGVTWSTVAKQLAAHRESESQLVREFSGTHGTGFGLVASPKEVVEGTIKCPRR
jgi:hypothetical protein